MSPLSQAALLSAAAFLSASIVPPGAGIGAAGFAGAAPTREGAPPLRTVAPLALLAPAFGCFFGCRQPAEEKISAMPIPRPTIGELTLERMALFTVPSERGVRISFVDPRRSFVRQAAHAVEGKDAGRRSGRLRIVGETMQQVASDVWTTARRQRFWGVETGTRMTVVRLAGGGLFVHCPVELDARTRAEVEALGVVRAVVSSSLYHHLYVGQWMEAYPDAVFGACPGLETKRPDLEFGHVLGDEPHPLWAADLEPLLFSARFEREVVFFHGASRTMICADALLNLSEHASRVTRAVAALMGNTAPGKGYLERIAVRDRRAARTQVDRMLRWDIERIVLAHGGLVERDGREVLRRAYAWL